MVARTVGSDNKNKEFEQWQNSSAGRVVLKRVNQRGQLTDEMIGSFRKFQITEQERKINSEMAADETLDPFQNGLLVPVRLIESADDYAKIKANPNLVGEDDMKALLAKSTVKVFRERMEGISNPYTLQRMLEIASNDDNATNRQVETIRERLQAVSPSTYTEVTSVSGPPRSSGMNPVSPR